MGVAAPAVFVLALRCDLFQDAGEILRVVGLCATAQLPNRDEWR